MTTAQAQKTAISLETTCENDCIFCRDARSLQRKGSSPASLLAALKDWIRQAADRGVRELEIGGSEPLNGPLLFALLDVAKQQGMKDITLITTGRKLKSMRLLRRLCSQGVTCFRIPIYGSKKRIHEAVTRTPGSFRDLIHALENLKRVEATTYLRCLALRCNQGDLSNLTRTVLKKFPQMHFGIADLKPTSESLIFYRNIFPGYRSLFPHLKKAYQCFKAARPLTPGFIDYFFSALLSFPFCLIDRIDPRFLKTQTAKKILRDKDFRDSDSSYSYARRCRPAPCRGCRYRDACPGLYTVSYLAYGEGDLFTHPKNG